jgi:hypothetical protein
MHCKQSEKPLSWYNTVLSAIGTLKGPKSCCLTSGWQNGLERGNNLEHKACHMGKTSRVTCVCGSFAGTASPHGYFENSRVTGFYSHIHPMVWRSRELAGDHESLHWVADLFFHFQILSMNKLKSHFQNLGIRLTRTCGSQHGNDIASRMVHQNRRFLGFWVPRMEPNAVF